DQLWVAEARVAVGRMTTGELIRLARTRAGLSQEELAERLHLPRPQIARWERDAHDPGFMTVRRVLHACGFDLSLTLIPYERDAEREERLHDLQRKSPQDRLRAMVERSRES